MGTVLTDHTELTRYELVIDGRLAAIEEYTLRSGVIALNHTEVLPDFAGKGAARELVTAVLDDARRRELAVLPHCPYVARIIGKDPDAYLNLVPAESRAAFGLPG